MKKIISLLLSALMMTILCVVNVSADTTYVAQVGEKKYETLDGAINAASENIDVNDKVIVLLSDLENTGKILLPDQATLDGDGHTISGDSSIELGKVAHVKNIIFKNIHNNVDRLSAIYATNGDEKFIVENCEFDNVDWDCIQFTPAAGAEGQIVNNVFKHSATGQAHRYIHVQSDKNVDFVIAIKFNKFYDCDKLTDTGLEVYYPANIGQVNVSHNFMDAPMGVCVGLGSNYNDHPELTLPFITEDSVEENYETVEVTGFMLDKDGNDKLYMSDAEAIANGAVAKAEYVYGNGLYQYFDTLAKAIETVSADGEAKTITLINDIGTNDNYKAYESVSANTIKAGQNVILDLNGHKVYAKTTVNGETCFLRVENGGSLKIKSSKAGGEIKYLDANDNAGGFVVCSAGAFKLESGTLENVTKCVNSAIQGAVDVHANEWGTPYTENTSFLMTGGVLKSNSDNTLRLYDSSQTGSGKVNITCDISGGEIYGADAVFIMPQWTKGYDVSHSETYTNNITLNVTDGVFDTNNGIRVAGKTGENNNKDEKTIKINVSGGDWKIADRTKYRVNNVALQDTGTWKSTKADTEKLNTFVDVKWKVDVFNGSSLVNTYDSLEDAINHVDNNQTVKLRTNMLLNETLTINTGKKFALDLNGKNIEMTNEPFSYANKVEGRFSGPAIIIKDKVLLTDSTEKPGSINLKTKDARVFAYDGGDVTIEKITIFGDYAAFYVIGDTSYEQNKGVKAGNLTLNSGLLKGNTCAVVVQGKGSTFTLNNGEVTIGDSGSYAISGNGSHDVGGSNRWNTTININGGLVNGNKSIGIYHPQGGDSVLNITDGKVIGSTAVCVKGGKVNISDNAVLEGTKDFEDPSSAAVSGTNDPGNAIYVEGSYKTHDPSVVITGGKFKAGNYAPDLLIDFNDNNASIKANAGFYDGVVDSKYIADGYECIALDSTYQSYIDEGYTHRIGFKTSKGEVIHIDTDNDVPTEFDSISSLNEAVENILEANKEKELNNKDVKQTVIEIKNNSPITETIKIDDNITIIANKGDNNIEAKPGFKIEVDETDPNTNTYVAVGKDIGEGDALDIEKGIKDTELKETNVENPEEIDPSILNTLTSVIDIDDNDQLEKIVSNMVNNIETNKELNINQGTATRALNNIGANIDEKSHEVSVFVNTYYETEVIENNIESDKEFTIEITPMFEVFASTSNDKEKAFSKEALNPEIKDKEVFTTQMVAPSKVDCDNAVITVRVLLPENFAKLNDHVYVDHTTKEGKVMTYGAKLIDDEDGIYAEFINPDGFSGFRFYINNPIIRHKYNVPNTGIK